MYVVRFLPVFLFVLKGDLLQDGASGSESEDDDNSEELGSEGEEQFSDIDDLESDEAQAHKIELAKLAEQDPEFYKYLQDNDKELLDFDVEARSDDEEDIDMDGGDVSDKENEDTKAPVLTKEILRKWQKGILEVFQLQTYPFTCF